MSKNMLSTAEIDEYAETAHKLVDYVIENAIKKLQDEVVDRQNVIEAIRQDLKKEPGLHRVPSPPRQENFEVQNIDWGTIGNFTVEAGEKKISEFIQVSDFHGYYVYYMY